MTWRPFPFLTPVRTGGLVLLGAAAALAVQWLRPTNVPADHPDWHIWRQPESWHALGWQPWRHLQLHTPRWIEPPAVVPALPDMPPPPAPAVQPMASLAERPLFSPNRRPAPPPPPPPPPKPPDPLENAALIGVMSGQRPLALIRLGNGSVQRLPAGGQIGFWRLEEIQTDAVTFVHDGQRRRYPMATGNLGQGTPPPPVAPLVTQEPIDQVAADPQAALQRAQQQIEQRAEQRARVPVRKRGVPSRARPQSQ